MANGSIAKDLGRLAKALDQQTPRWGPVLVTLLGAEDKATAAFMDTTILKKPYKTNTFDKNLAFGYAFNNTRLMQQAWAHGLPGWLFGGFYEGFFYFTAIFKHLEGYQQERFRPDLQRTGMSSFGEVWGRVRRLWKALAKDFERLAAAVGSEPKEMPDDHAANALATMLLSPILYTPKAEPDQDQLARKMEWYIWLKYMPHVIEVIMSDYYREKARDTAIVDLGPMFERLQAITAKGTDGLIIPEVMKDLKKFRAGLENRKIEAKIFQSVAPLEIAVDVQFPPGLKSYQAADAEGKRKIVRGAAKTIKWSDAGL
jgi:hypothetical protein